MFVLARVYDYESSVYKTEVHEYNLNMAFDISTSSYEQQSSVNSAESDPTGITFDSSGGKMFIVGNDKDAVVEYNLSSNFDISTMTYVGEFSVNSQETSPKGVAFNSDGTKMYITGNASDDVNEYHLSTGFNVSTASFEQSFSVSTEELSAQGLTFNPDGTKMFIVGSIGDEVNEYHIKESTPPTLSSAVFTSATQLNVTFSEAVAAYGNNPGDFTLTDGASTTFAVTGIADATPGDSKLELTVADVIAASGALTLTYTNNNGEVTDYNNNALASDGTGVTLSPLVTLSSGYKESDTSIQLGFSAPVQTNGGNPGDFTVTDAHGTTFAVSAQSDGVAGDYYINLTTADLSAAIWPLTVTYTNNNGEISDLSGAQVLSTSGVSISNASASFDVSEAAYTQLFSTTSQ
ncbi:MAG: hypothetical protein ABJV04_17085, partial [Aliiglaciecola sp.]|uniref:YncE family protein n=1 Tax=Aliiglaciecola sp. TaxID=1872441 RepID=UPI003297CC9A